MPSKRDINLHRYDISLYAYRELKYFCMQYDEKRKQIAGLYAIGKGTDPTAYMAIDILRLRKEIDMIEKTAYEIAGRMAPQMIASVTRNIPYERLSVPCGRRQFYELRRKFYYLLHMKKGNTGDV